LGVFLSGLVAEPLVTTVNLGMAQFIACQKPLVGFGSVPKGVIHRKLKLIFHFYWEMKNQSSEDKASIFDVEVS
jgi:hypothetical protein